jgi:hypothetical protein
MDHYLHIKCKVLLRQQLKTRWKHKILSLHKKCGECAVQTEPVNSESFCKIRESGIRGIGL